MSTFTRLTRDGDVVHKQLVPLGAFDVITRALCHGGPAAMADYIATLRAAGVRLPQQLDIVDDSADTNGTDQPDSLPSVRHHWTNGPTLPQVITTEPERAVGAIRTVLGWLEALEPTDSRIDTNLANFCLPDDGAPVLIDVLPPLIPSARPTARTPFETLFDALAFDTAITRAAFLGYAARALLQADHAASAAVVLELAPADLGAAFPAAWFGARLTLARAVADGRAPQASMQRLYKSTSVLALSQLGPCEQLLRVHDAWDVLGEGRA